MLLCDSTNLPNETLIYYLTNEATKNWRKLLELGKTLELDEKRKFLWIWPTAENLTGLKNKLENLNIPRILSVGCGNGLLEWLIKESIDIPVFGLEVDKSWWQSSYSVKSFIELNYIDDIRANHDQQQTNLTEFLQQCCHTADWKFALLFCYFNNRSAFLQYLEMYKGNWIILIGPQPEAGIHTDPSPLDPRFPANSQWQLSQQSSIGEEKDIVAVYTKF